MGSIRQRGRGWRADINRHGHREGRTFSTRQQAADWIVAREAELLANGTTARNTLAEAVARRLEHPVMRSERYRLERFALLPWATKPMARVTVEDLSAWRDERLKAVSPGSVLREITSLRALFEAARLDWGWIKTNPLSDLRKPPRPPDRKRIITDDERDIMVAALGFDGQRVEQVRHEVAVVFLLALQTAMRSGEIIALEWSRVHERHVSLRKTKNGDARDVPLSIEARRLLDVMRHRRLLHVHPLDDGRVFHVRPDACDVLFRRAREDAGLSGFTLHDSRATAITRLAKILDPLELARMVGHRDLSSLMAYFRMPADQIAERLG